MMSIKSRLKGLEKRYLTHANIVVHRFPDGFEFWMFTEPKTKTEAITWILSSAIEESLIIVDGLEKWPQHLQRYRNLTEFISVAYLIDKFNIKPTEIA